MVHVDINRRCVASLRTTIYINGLNLVQSTDRIGRVLEEGAIFVIEPTKFSLYKHCGY